MLGSVTDFLKPRLVDIRAISPTHAKVTLEPLERGFDPHAGQCPASYFNCHLCPVVQLKSRSTNYCTSAATKKVYRRDILEILLNLKGIAASFEAGSRTR